MNARWQKRVTVLCAVVLAMAVFAETGDATSGSVVGVVRGPGGVALSGATITLTDQSGHSPAAVVTGNGGEFKITGLSPGAYEVHAELQGFHPSTATRISVLEGQAARERS